MSKSLLALLTGSVALVACMVVSCQMPTQEIISNTDDSAINSVDNRAIINGLDTTKTPGQNFNLSTYSLQIPESNGSGGVKEVSGSALTTYTSSWFYTGTDGAMVFYCPDTGATTPNSHYPRSELRDKAEFTLSGTHTLSASCAVLAQPSTGQTIIGQIHGHLTGSEALKVRWNNGAVLVGFKKTIGATEEKIPVLTGVALGAKINYKVVTSGHTLTVTINNVTITRTYDSSWDADSLYFKLGNYVQDDTASGSVSRVAFYTVNGKPVAASPSPSPIASATPSPSVSPSPLPVYTVSNTGGWLNKSFTAKTASFTFKFNATPSAAASNSVVGLSKASASDYAGYACMVRFNPTGSIDARKGSAYAAATSVPYSAGVSYAFRVVVNVSAKTYSVYVTSPGGSEKTLASGYAFRTEQAAVTSIANWGAQVHPDYPGTLKISNVVIQ